MDFFEDAALAMGQRAISVRLAETPDSVAPLHFQQEAVHAPASPVIDLETDSLSGLFGSLPIVADTSDTVPSLAFPAPIEPTEEQPDTPPQEALVADTGLPAGSLDSNVCDVPDAMAVHAAAVQPPVPTLALSAEPGDGRPAEAPAADAVAMAKGADIDDQASVGLQELAEGVGHGALDDAAADVPPASPGYTACWRALLGLQRSVKHAIVTCAVVTKDVFGTSFVLGEAGNLNAIRNGMVSELVGKAIESFRYHGVSLDIVADSVRKALGTKGNFHPDWPDDRAYYYLNPRERLEERQNRDRLDQLLSEEFDPDAVWAYLQAQFSGPAGERMALQKVARLLFQQLGLQHRAPGEDKGQLLITISAWNDKRSTWPPSRVYCDSTRQSLRSARQYLAEFAKWAAEADCAKAFGNQHVPVLDESNCAIVSRSKVRIGSTEWTFYNERIEIRFAPELGLKFRAFVAEFGPRPVADR